MTKLSLSTSVRMAIREQVLGPEHPSNCCHSTQLS